MNPELIPQQQVLIDNVAIATFVMVAPNDPTKAVVESFGTGPFVVNRSQLQPLT